MIDALSIVLIIQILRRLYCRQCNKLCNKLRIGARIVRYSIAHMSMDNMLY